MRKTRLNLKKVTLLSGCMSFAVSHAALGSLPGNFDPDTFSYSKTLKLISDEEWKTIAGSYYNQDYSVVKGDTLSLISKKILGNKDYWPKLWSINPLLTNPHHIFPGFKISFKPNSRHSGKEPRRGLSSEDSPEVLTESQEWRLLPRQKWEQVPIHLPPGVDISGFDERSVAKGPKQVGMEPTLVPASHPISPAGKIVAARSIAETLFLGDTVLIQAENSLQPGVTYTVTREPLSFHADRTGYGYINLGKIKILQAQGDLYVGEITSMRGSIERGNLLIPLVPKVPPLPKIYGQQETEGKVIFNPGEELSNAIPFAEVFINLGSEEGIQPGMIFRSFQHKDPNTEKTFSDGNFLIQTELQVTQVSENICSAAIIRGSSPISHETPVVLATSAVPSGKPSVSTKEQANPGEKEDEKKSDEKKEDEKKEDEKKSDEKKEDETKNEGHKEDHKEDDVHPLEPPPESSESVDEPHPTPGVESTDAIPL